MGKPANRSLTSTPTFSFSLFRLLTLRALDAMRREGKRVQTGCGNAFSTALTDAVGAGVDTRQRFLQLRQQFLLGRQDGQAFIQTFRGVVREVRGKMGDVPGVVSCGGYRFGNAGGLALNPRLNRQEPRSIRFLGRFIHEGCFVLSMGGSGSL